MTKRIDNIGLFIQLYLVGLTILALVLSFYTKLFADLLYFLVAAIMFAQSYNNQKIYKRKNMTYIYFMVGIMLLVLGVISAI